MIARFMRSEISLGVSSRYNKNQAVNLVVSNFSYDAVLNNSLLLTNPLDIAAVNNSPYRILNGDRMQANFYNVTINDINYNDTILDTTNRAFWSLYCSRNDPYLFFGTLHTTDSRFSNIHLNGSRMISTSSKNLNSTNFCGISLQIERSSFSDFSSIGDGQIIDSNSSQVSGKDSNSIFLHIKESSFRISPEAMAAFILERGYTTIRLFVWSTLCLKILI